LRRPIFFKLSKLVSQYSFNGIIVTSYAIT
jgi:hypothetical protein